MAGVPIFLRNKGVGGCARRLVGCGKPKERSAHLLPRSAHLSSERCDIHVSTFLHFYTAKNKNDSPPFYTFLHVLHG